MCHLNILHEFMLHLCGWEVLHVVTFYLDRVDCLSSILPAAAAADDEFCQPFNQCRIGEDSARET